MSITASPTEQREHFLSLLKKFHTAMLITITGGQQCHMRPMAIARVEDDGHLWFITAGDTAKVHEIEKGSHVHLTAQDGDSAFLALSGRATLMADREKIAELWQEPFRVWFPGGKDDPDIELISVRPDRGEYWDNTGLNRCKYLWESAKAYATGTTPDPDQSQNARVQL
jgi:general stress protein 26